MKLSILAPLGANVGRFDNEYEPWIKPSSNIRDTNVVMSDLFDETLTQKNVSSQDDDRKYEDILLLQ